MQMGPFTTDNGFQIFPMEKESKNCQMAHPIRGNFKTAKNMVVESLFGMMGLNTKGDLLKGKSRVKEAIFGPIKGPTRASGRII